MENRNLEERDWLYSFMMLEGIGRKTLQLLYENIHSFSEIPQRISYEMLVSCGISKAKSTLLLQVTCDYVRRDKEKRERDGISFVCFLDNEYPDCLTQIPDPPLLLYYRGNLSLLKKMMIGVVGTRRPSAYGRTACQFFVQRLASAGFVIVSGLATGIDTEAHRVTLKHRGETVAVLGCGINHIYPAHNRLLYKEIASTGLLLSEYPPETEPKPGLFPERNRIISGLSRGLLIVEAAERSGSLITADFANEQGREVFAVPGPIFSSTSIGPNNLLKQGAKLVTSIEDILEEFPDCKHKLLSNSVISSKILLTEEERCLFQLFSDEPKHWDHLYAGIQSDQKTTLDRDLMRLQAKGLIEGLPGGYFVKRGEKLE